MESLFLLSPNNHCKESPVPHILTLPPRKIPSKQRPVGGASSSKNKAERVEKSRSIAPGLLTCLRSKCSYRFFAFLLRCNRSLSVLISQRTFFCASMIGRTF